jgi:hypothetical protein
VTRIQAGPQAQEVTSADGGSAVAIHLADEGAPGLLRTWRIEVFADRGDGLIQLGEITTRTPPAPPAAASPALPPQPRSRVVAICSCPGSIRWTVRVRYANEGGPATLPIPIPACEITLLDSPVASTPGLQAVNERSHYISGTAPGSVNLARGQRVQSWAAFSTGAGATANVNNEGAIPIPTSGAVRGDPEGSLDGGLFVFAGANFGGYFIEFRES